MEIHHRIQDHIAIVYFEIRLSLDEIDVFKDYVTPLIDNSEIKGMLINLVDVEFIDSSGFGTFISLYKKLKETQKKLGCCQANEEILEIFNMLALDDKIRLFPTEEEAMAYFQE